MLIPFVLRKGFIFFLAVLVFCFPGVFAAAEPGPGADASGPQVIVVGGEGETVDASIQRPSAISSEGGPAR